MNTGNGKNHPKRADSHPWKRGAKRRQARAAAIHRNAAKGKR